MVRIKISNYKVTKEDGNQATFIVKYKISKNSLVRNYVNEKWRW